MLAPTRVRDCVANQFFEVGLQQADASRRQSGPRKATLGRSSTVRFRCKSCLAFGPDGQRYERRLVVAIDAANASAGECGVENQVGWVGVLFSSRTSADLAEAGDTTSTSYASAFIHDPALMIALAIARVCSVVGRFSKVTVRAINVVLPDFRSLLGSTLAMSSCP